MQTIAGGNRSPTSDAESTGQVRAVERAVGLMFRVAEHPGNVSLQQLADEIGCSKSTVHRLLGTLERLEVVERDPALRQYRLGRRLRALQQEAPASLDLRPLAAPYLPDLRDQSGETVTLHALDGAAHVIIGQCESPHEIRLVYPLGQRIPLAKGATAKAIIAFLPPEQRARLAPLLGGELPASEEELEDIRHLGYACSLAERIAGSSTIAVPLRDARGQVVGALALSGPSTRFTPARALRCAPALLDAAHATETALLTDKSPLTSSDQRGHR